MQHINVPKYHTELYKDIQLLSVNLKTSLKLLRSGKKCLYIKTVLTNWSMN